MPHFTTSYPPAGAGWGWEGLPACCLPRHACQLAPSPCARPALTLHSRPSRPCPAVLRKISSKEEDQLGDTSTLADPGVVKVLLELRGK